MGVLFGFCHAEVAEVGLGHEVGEEVVHRFGRDDDGELEVFVILSHADVVEVGGDGAEGYLCFELCRFGERKALAADGVCGEAGRACEDAGDLAGAIGAVVEVDDHVVVADEADGGAIGGIDAGEGRDELVGDAVVVEFPNSDEGAFIATAFGIASDHCIEGLLFFFPAAVTVHGVVAAADAGQETDVIFVKFALEFLKIVRTAGGHGVAAVHEGVDEDAGEFVFGGHAEEGVEVALVGVDAAVGEETDEVERSSLLGCEFVGFCERGIGVEGAVEDGGVDAGHVHVDDAAGTEVEVADFAVAHLPVGEADEVFAGAEEGIGVVAEERVVGGLAGLGNGVAVGLGAVTPSVEDGEDDWCFGHDGSVSLRLVLMARISTLVKVRGRERSGFLHWHHRFTHDLVEVI